MTASLFRVMARHIWRRPLQSTLFVVGVMIGVAMMVAIDMANHSATRAFELSTDSVAGRATHQIVGGPNGVPEDVYLQLRREIGWQLAAPVVEDFVTVDAFEARPLRLFGVDPLAEPPFRNYITAEDQSALDQVAVGRFLVQPNTVLIGQGLAAQYGLAPEDTITVSYGDQRINLTVVAILRADDELTNRALSGLLVVDIATAQEVLAKTGRLSRIDLLVDEDDPAAVAALEAIRASLPPDVRVEVPALRREALSQITDSFQLNLTALSLLALVVGMFLIYNTVSFSVVQRRSVLGTLRSLGVTRRQIFALVIGEAALLSSLGALLGLVLGASLLVGAGPEPMTYRLPLQNRLVSGTFGELRHTHLHAGLDIRTEGTTRWPVTADYCQQPSPRPCCPAWSAVWPRCSPSTGLLAPRQAGVGINAHLRRHLA
ncbi:MAG: ABC transporter permease, partial [Anaerolineae bacterium]|nr:ABC transporter permease [Anaerolineae bacterium]